jgi:hypothetical protein
MQYHAPQRIGLTAVVVGSFVSDGHIVWVALFSTSSGDSHEACTLMQFGQRSSTCITHARAQTTNELIDHIGK